MPVTEISADTRREILTYLDSRQVLEIPFDEFKSYNDRSTHSNRLKMQLDMRSELGMGTRCIFEEVRSIYAAVEKYFQLAYVYSAIFHKVHPEIHRGSWFHEPASALHTTFMDLWRGSYTAPLGLHLWHEEFVNDPAVKAVYDTWTSIIDGYNNSSEIPDEQWVEMLATLKSSKDATADEIRQRLAT